MSIHLNLIKERALRVEGKSDNIDDLTIFINSREQIDKGLFVPLVGDRFDGHDFLKEAIHAGAEATLWMEGKPLPEDIPENFLIFFVDDTLKALQDLSKTYLLGIAPKVVAITGSNGKTTTKDIVESVVATSYRTHKTKGNFNNHFGLPLTILAMPKDCEVLILEMGMNHFGEISLLSKIAPPDIAVITNIGESHIEFLGSREGIAKAKLEIVDGMKAGGTLVIDGDEPLLKSYRSKDQRIISCGYHKDNDNHITTILADVNGYQFNLNHEQDAFHIPLLGKHNVKNAAFSITVAYRLDIKKEMIQEGFNQLSMTGMRLETILGKEGSLLLNDAYNASPTSMEAAIETTKALPHFKRRVIVLGNMYELGSDEEKLHRQVAGIIRDPLTHVITIGEKAKWIADECATDAGEITITSYPDKTKALPYLKTLLSPETVILFKASRIASLETLVEELKA